MSTGNLNGTRFLVEIRVITNDKTGEEFLVLSDEQLDEQFALLERQAQKSAEVKRAMGAKENIIDLEYKRDLAWASVNIARQKEDSKIAMPNSVLHSYKLIRPTYGEHLEAEEHATTINAVTYDTSQDQGKYINYLFPHAVEGLTSKEVLNLSPLIGRELRNKLMQSIYPSPDRVLFTLTR